VCRASSGGIVGAVVAVAAAAAAAAAIGIGARGVGAISSVTADVAGLLVSADCVAGDNRSTATALYKHTQISLTDADTKKQQPKRFPKSYSSSTYKQVST
jgi:hypothetical protein